MVAILECACETMMAIVEYLLFIYFIFILSLCNNKVHVMLSSFIPFESGLFLLIAERSNYSGM